MVDVVYRCARGVGESFLKDLEDIKMFGQKAM